MNPKKTNELLYIGIVCLAAIVVIIPVIAFGIPSGNDLPQHFQFAQTYYDSIVNGDGFPSWSDKENFGYGGIGIRFYPPLAYYILAFARILTGNWFDASCLSLVFWMVLGCIGVYFWTRWWLSPAESAVAGVVYAFIPYHLSQLYTFSFIYADFAAAAILPFCFAFLTRALAREKRSDILAFAVVYAALVLTHLPTTITGSLSLAFYAVLLSKKEVLLRQISKFFIGIGLGLTASAFYWVRMISEINWLNHATDRFSSGHYGFSNGFFPGYFQEPTERANGIVLTTDIMFVLSFLFLASALIYYFYRKTNFEGTDTVSKVFWTVLPLGLLGFFMTTPLSFPVWKILPPLQKIQFPWRWVSIVSMCGAVVMAASFHYFVKGHFHRKKICLYLFAAFPLIVLFFNVTYIFNPMASLPIDRQQFESDMQELPSKESFNCWWSVWSKPDALNIKEKVLAENRSIEINDWKPEERKFTIAEGSAVKARIATFYYPHWRANVNGIPVKIEKDDNGAMMIPLPSEKSLVEIKFEEPFVVKSASAVSVICWLFIFLMFLYVNFEKRSSSNLPNIA
jgi:hypothetical protein